jgi:hypothetical protein
MILNKFLVLPWWLSVCLLLDLGYLNAQDLMSLQLNGYYSGTILHPGLKLDKRINVTGSDFAIGGGVQGVPLSEYLTKTGKGEYTLKKIGYELNRYDRYFANISYNIIGLGILVKDFHLLGGFNFRTKADAGVPSDLLELIYRGNGQYIGKTLQIGPSLDVLSFSELYLGFQKSWGPLTFGLKAKSLSGIAVARTKGQFLELTTSTDNYDIKLESDLLLESSNILNVSDTSLQSIEKISFGYKPFSTKGFFRENTGFGLDMGASINFGNNLVISFGVTDIGKIIWDKNTSIYESKGTFQYTGLDIVEFLENDNSDYSIEDSIKTLLNLKRYGSQFNTGLGANIILSGTYQFRDKWHFYGLFQSQGGMSLRKQHLVLGASRRFSILELGVQYSAISTRSFANLGVNAAIKIGPVKVYASTDNAYSIFKPTDCTYASFRVGVCGQL